MGLEKKYNPVHGWLKDNNVILLRWHYFFSFTIFHLEGNAAGIHPTPNKYTPFLYIDKMGIALYLEPILDPLSKEYANVLTVDAYPEGPLKDFVKQKRLPELSEFKKSSTTQCKYVLVHPDTIEYQQTKLYKHPNLVCLFSYTAV